MTVNKIRLAIVMALATTSAAQADPPFFSYEGGITAVAQKSDLKKLEAGFSVSADLVAHYQKQNWQVNLHLEGNVTPDDKSITAQFPDVNADAFSAFDKNKNGRIQISEFNVDYAVKQAAIDQISFGLMDPTNFFDGNEIMNDENTQFLAVPFTNNPTIEFPYYTIGVVTNINVGLKPYLKTTLGAFSGQGIGDKEGKYSFSPDKDGGFFIAETQLMETPIHKLSGGAWVHTGKHTHLKKTTQDNLNNYGLYLTGSHQMGQNTFALRLGYSRPEVNELNKVLSLSIQHQYNTQWTTGAAGSYQAASYDNIHDTQAYEVYARYQPVKADFYITPSVQYFRNTSIAKNITTASLRLSYQF